MKKLDTNEDAEEGRPELMQNMTVRGLFTNGRIDIMGNTPRR